jgi:predicted lipid carrier protein YhbT
MKKSSRVPKRSSSGVSRKSGTASRAAAETVLKTLAKQLDRVHNLRKATVLLRITGDGGGDYCLACSPEGVRVSADVPLVHHDLEVVADRAHILAMIEGRRDARTVFLTGNVRVRGNVQYWSDVAYELGLIKERI